jgi:serine/threonine-protein kinase RsbW
MPFLAEFRAAMTAAGYPDDAVLGMGLALDEAIANGFDHGTRGDPAKEVRVAYHVGRRRVFAEVEDDGDGFTPGAVADPLAPENLGRPDGRGLLLMRELTTSIRHNARGNRVILCKEFPRG